MLSSSPSPLCSRYDLAMLDLDGVVYVGKHAVPGVPDQLTAVRSAGMRVAFITNNAARTPDAVAAHLVELGVPAEPGDVVTSAQAASRLLSERFPAGSRIVRLGGAGLDAALRAAGFEPVEAAEDAVAVASGYGPEVRWADIMKVAVRVRDGLPWVASNTDLTIPTDFGVAPGHGVLVETISRFSGVVPDVAGKPRRPLLDETIRRVGGERPLMVGDRLDTDIEGARAAGIDSLLVLTGVTRLDELVSAAPPLRPTFLAPGLEGLLEPHPEPIPVDDGWVLPGWRARVAAGRLEVKPDGSAGTEADWWRVVAAAAWAHHDATGVVPDVSALAR